MDRDYLSAESQYASIPNAVRLRTTHRVPSSAKAVPMVASRTPTHGS
jgi:hypothetical protein